MLVLECIQNHKAARNKLLKDNFIIKIQSSPELFNKINSIFEDYLF